AITFLQTGFQQPGRPSMGAWVSYGLGSENQNLPAFVVLISQANALNPDQPLFSRLWGSGFLPSRYQGVKFRSSGDPVLYLSNPPGVSSTIRIAARAKRSEEHTSELQSPYDLVCRLLLEKKNKKRTTRATQAP